MNRYLLYAVAFYLALCATCYTDCRAQTIATRAGDTEEKQVDRMLLHILSCPLLADLGERIALDVLDVEKDAKARGCTRRSTDAICVGYREQRAEYMQRLTDVDEEEHERCGLDRR